MTLKEKLELLWKYLLLAAIIYGIAQIGTNHRSKMMGENCSHNSGHDMMWFGDDDHDFDDMDVEVMIEKLDDGDSTVQIIINGETMDIKDLEKIDENLFVKKMGGDHKGKEHKVKIIKKKMIDN